MGRGTVRPGSAEDVDALMRAVSVGPLAEEGSPSARPRVLVIQELLPHYRIEFFDAVRRNLADYGVVLDLVHGRATGDRARFGDEVSLPWARQVVNRRFPASGSRYLVWQPVLADALSADLVIVEQANKHVVNALLTVLARRRLAMWGHGADLQEGSARRWASAVKRLMSVRCAWWFAYTHGSAARVDRLGFPPDQITAVQNAAPFPDPGEVDRVAGQCVYLGSLHRYKRLEFLVDAGRELSTLVSDFRLVVAGDGPDRALIESAARRYGWLYYVGAVHGVAKSELMCRSSIVLMPGLVGLVATDSFAARTPIATIANSKHSPEFEYLNDENSLVVPADCSAREYAVAVAELMRDEEKLRRLRIGCAASAAEVNVQQMAQRFSDGVLSALKATRKSR